MGTLDKDSTIYIDLTGKFPVRSMDGMTTVFILYNWTSNVILAEPIEKAQNNTMARVFKEKITYLTKRGFKPSFNIIGNVASKAVQAYLEKRKPTSS